MSSCPICGKRLDRNWSECPYCKPARKADNPIEAVVAPAKEKIEMPDNNPRNPTRVEQPQARRETKFQAMSPLPSSDTAPSGVRADFVDNRKIVGVLVTYSRVPEGELFPVREGRTHIGAGNIKEDTSHRVVDVHRPKDELMSEDHALILVQQKKFWIRDLDSVNGTFVNGNQLRPDTAEDLPDNAEIKAGKTVFTFLRIEQKSGAAASETTAPKREPADTPPPGKPTILR
jgi:hypothetical protein